jgi:hypothetical protein
MRPQTIRAQTWLRLGPVFCPAGDVPWMMSHASYPTPLVLADNLVRVYFSPRDAENRSSIAALDLALDGRRFEIVGAPRGPLLGPGAIGTFDDSGVTVSSVLADERTVRVWYLGWNLAVTVPFRNAIGLAEGPRDGRLARVSAAPVLDRSRADPISLGYPWVLRDNTELRMWYSSHEWSANMLETRHEIKTASSADGVTWNRSGRVVLAPAGGEELAVARPCVLRDADCFRMWFSRRYTAYRLGYAESQDGFTWTRRDEALRYVGRPGSWETDSMAYAAVFDCGCRRYMLYNGNGYGRSGFGLALLEDA